MIRIAVDHRSQVGQMIAPPTNEVHVAAFPLVTQLVNAQEAQFIQQSIEVFRHGMMGAADRVYAHLLEGLQSAYPDFPGDSCSHGTSIMMEIHAPKLGFYAVEEEAIFCIKHGGAHAKDAFQRIARSACYAADTLRSDQPATDPLLLFLAFSAMRNTRCGILQTPCTSPQHCTSRGIVQ